jgi:hypothetical protein
MEKLAIEEDFFIKLASKFKRETKFSDIIWTMCSSMGSFQNIFLEYCFDEKITIAGEMKREHKKEDSIPDFYFLDINNNEFIIENKIYNHGDHFDQYKSAFPDAKRAFIANYFEPEHIGWKVKTWKNFILYLEQRIEEFETERIGFIKGFIGYLKSLTNFSGVTSMNLSNLSSLYSFYNTVNEVVSECQLVKLENHNVPKAINCTYFGKQFYYSNSEQQKVYIWFGVFLPEPSVFISFPAYKNDAKLPKRERDILEKLTQGKYFECVDPDEGDFFIHLKDEYFKKLCSKNDIQEQKGVLKNFLEEILLLIK